VTLDDFGRVESAALGSIDSLLAEWFPNGVREGAEFCIGSRFGEAGKSMRVRLVGEKAGFWADFSADGEAGGGLISLYAHIHGLSQGKACAQLAGVLGVPLTDNPDWKAKASSRSATPAPQAKPKTPPPAPARSGVEAHPAVKKKTPWSPILPVPSNAGPYPKAHVVRGRPDATWEYKDQEGRLLGVVYRFTTSDGGKEVLPCVFAQHPETKAREWRWISFPEPRPLYLQGALRAGVPKLVVEGEKCADKAHALVGAEFDLISWPGGGKAVEKTDWSAVRDCDVILWPDADAKCYKKGHAKEGQLKPESEQPGMMAMQMVAEVLGKQGCNVFFVDIPRPGEVPDGWDVADLIDEGGGADAVVAWVTRLRHDVLAQQDKDPLHAQAERSVDSVPDSEVPAWLDEGANTELASTPRPASAAQGLSAGELRERLIPTANGGIKGCRENVYLVMCHDAKLQGLVGLDLFSGLQMKRRATPWQSAPGEWTESDDFSLGMYLAQNYGLVLASIGDIERGVAQAAREHSFDPVKDYLDHCESAWDGQARVATALSRYWSAEDSEYMRLVSTMFFIGIVMRGYKPGVKNDHAPVFEGGQGQGKSTALKVLGGDWFADTPFRMGDKDGFLSIQGVWLYEVAELEQFNRSEVTAIKAFMSSTVDRFREPYGRRMKNVPRRCAFAATTNEDAYFKDATGNRRFWPVETGWIDLKSLAADRDQLFGEAIALMRQGVKWWPTFEQQQRLIGPVQDDREIPDPWRGRIYEYLEGIDSDKKPTLSGKIKRVTAREILTKALHFELSKLGPARAETMRVGAIMRKFGWSKKREPTGAREWYYERPAAINGGAAADQGAAQ